MLQHFALALSLALMARLVLAQDSFFKALLFLGTNQASSQFLLALTLLALSAVTFVHSLVLGRLTREDWASIRSRLQFKLGLVAAVLLWYGALSKQLYVALVLNFAFESTLMAFVARAAHYSTALSQQNQLVAKRVALALLVILFLFLRLLRLHHASINLQFVHAAALLTSLSASQALFSLLELSLALYQFHSLDNFTSGISLKLRKVYLPLLVTLLGLVPFFQFRDRVKGHFVLVYGAQLLYLCAHLRQAFSVGRELSLIENNLCALETVTRLDLAEIEADETCAICMRQIADSGKVLPCRHVFHQECILNWLSLNRTRLTCPRCRIHIFAFQTLPPRPSDQVWSVADLKQLEGLRFALGSIPKYLPAEPQFFRTERHFRQRAQLLAASPVVQRL